MKSSVCFVFFAIFATVSPTAYSFSLKADSLVGLGTGGSTNNRLVSYDLDGNLLGSLDITQGEYAGVSILGTTVYLLDIYTNVYSVDLSTGERTFLFEEGSSRDGFGVYGGKFIGTRFSNSTVSTFDINGGGAGLSFTPRYGAGPVDGIGSQVLVANFMDGLVDLHAGDGAFVKSIDLGLVDYELGTLRGITGGLDNTFWVSLGGTFQEVRRYDLDGQLLSSFSSFGAADLQYSAVPEPMTLAVLGLGAFIASRRRKSV